MRQLFIIMFTVADYFPATKFVISATDWNTASGSCKVITAKVHRDKENCYRGSAK